MERLTVVKAKHELTDWRRVRVRAGLGSSFRPGARVIAILVLGIACTAPTETSWAQQAAAYFRQSCASCHTIGGGRLVGPDLKDVTKQRDRTWLINFIQNPQAVISGGDPYAQKLRDEARGVVMPTVVGMTPELAEGLLALIDAESKLEHSHFEGLKISDKPFTPADIARGETFFAGRQGLAAGGPACIACHTTGQLGGLGGGRLGPDLSRVFERLHGRRALASWLLAPASPTMRAVFIERPLRAEEIMPLVAFLEENAKRGGDDERPQALDLLLLALGGLAACVVCFDTIWKARLRSVRRALVEGRRLRGNR